MFLTKNKIVKISCLISFFSCGNKQLSTTNRSKTNNTLDLSGIVQASQLDYGLKGKKCTEEKYYQLRPDVVKAGMSAQLHYQKHGINEGMCHPTETEQTSREKNFSGINIVKAEAPNHNLGNTNCTAEKYLQIRPDVVAAQLSAQEHYNRYGKNEGMCNPTGDTSNRVAATAPNHQMSNKTCTPEKYLQLRPDVVGAGMTARVHYEKYGKSEGMCEPVGSERKQPVNSKQSNENCSAAEYLKRRPDVAAAGMNAFAHYSQHGINEGMCRPNDGDFKSKKSTSSNLDTCSATEYLRKRPDVAASGMSAVAHYIKYGKNEGMCMPPNNSKSAPAPKEARTNNSANTCSAAEYLKRRPDVANAGMSAYIHYNKHGKYENMCKPN